MSYLVGVVLAAAVSLSATFIGLDRDRAFYATVLIVIASYYALFAVMGGSLHVLALEAPPILAFLGLALVGFRRSSWFLVIGLIAHGVFDYLHGHVIENPGVPTWWPSFCLAYDVTAGAYLALTLRRAARSE